VQYNEYYPFQNPTQNSWTRVNAVKNNFLGNGGTELNTTSNLYDPVLGRMNGVDPMADKYSSLTPYNFSFNDPVTFTDANGADPWWQRYTDMHGGMLDGFHNAVVDGGGGGAGAGDPFMNSGYRFAYGRNSDFGNRRSAYDDARDIMQGKMSMETGAMVWNPWYGYMSLNDPEAWVLLANKGNDPRVQIILPSGKNQSASDFINQMRADSQPFFSTTIGLTGVPSDQHPGGKYGMAEVGFTHTLVSAWYEKNAYLIQRLTGALPKVVTTFGKGLGLVGVGIAVVSTLDEYSKNGFTTNVVAKGVIGIGLGAAGAVAAFTSPVWGTAIAVGGIAYGALDYFGVVDNVINGTKSFWSDVKNQTVQGYNSFNNIGVQY
jgi:hypothetical protein